MDIYLALDMIWRISLKIKKIINGITDKTTMERGYANGMECLVAQFIRENKTCIGSLYIQSIDSSTEYDYEVRYIDDTFIIKVDNFEGTPEELLKYKEKCEED
jgi:hypothetical protein